MHNIVDPLLLDRTWQEANARLRGENYDPPSYQELMEATEEARNRDAAPAVPTSQVEQIKAGQAKQAEEEAARKAAKEKQEALERAGAEAMRFAWRTAPTCLLFRQGMVDTSLSVAPFNERCEAVLPGLRVEAIASLVESVRNTPGCESFTNERLHAEAEGFIVRFEKPVDGAGGALPRSASKPAPMRQTATRSESLTLWADDAGSEDMERKRREEQERLHQLGIRREMGFGALAYRAY